MRTKWIFLLLFLASQVVAQTLITKVIQLNYVQSGAMITLLKPLLQPEEQISGSGQTLIVRVKPDTLTQIRDVLHKLDVAPVTLSVSIYQGPPNWLSAQNTNSVTYSTQSPGEVRRSQSVNVMTGESAFIATDQQVPIVSSVGVGFFTGVSYQQHNIKTGFLVQPVLQGGGVRLSIKRVRQQQNAAGGQQFDNQAVDTTVMVPLNKWVQLGTAEGVQNNNANDTVFTAGRNFSRDSTLFIKVSIVKKVPVGPSK